ncbi:Tether containing UBX domain for GLUT4 [Mortierella sp. AD011]|nr:Tether containing UBX domain for GLUT4 [Mortierella sp. AD010]KAF9402493.1 Tether containing UBX domain for GLUT4 [Mortierella sp. AD011]
MASNLTVFLGGGKKQLVKTTPTMILRQVVNIVCEKQNYAEPESYGLKSGKNFLDLSLSIRYANIAPGAKLELAKAPKDKSAPTHVDLALQLEDGGRMIQSFAVTTTLWDVLLGFEKASNGTLNLTRRTAVPQPTSKNIFSLQRIKKAVKPSTEVYLLPVVILLEREYVSIPTLKTTSLQLAGLLKGNAVFRVMMRYTDAGIADFIEDIERDYSHPTKTNSEPNHSSSSTASPPHSHSASHHPSSASLTPTSASSATTSHMEYSSPSQQGSAAYPVKIPTRQPTMDKTMGEVDFIQAKEAFNPTEFGINPQGIELPGMTGRSGSVEVEHREGNMVTPVPGSGINIDIQRQTPVQDMSAAMIEHSQEIRQRQEQQTQAAMSDRVKKLSRASDDSDRERFVRSLPPGSYGEVTEEPSNMMDVDSKELVLQIAQLVSQKLKSAQQRGDSTVDYQTLIAEEIEKKQRAGVLPSTPSGSRHNSYIRSKVEDDSSPMLIAPPSRALTLAPVEEKVVEEKVVEEKVDREVKVFRAPADSSTPLSNQIDLPDDFYELSSQDVMKLMNSQKAKREQEESRGFKTAAARAEEEKAREKRYPKTIIRIRFPDRVQIQGTFRSQETIGDLRKWVASVCVGQGEKFDLYTTPPKKVLTDNKQTLYQAGLAPQSIVSFSWVDTKLNTNSSFLNDEYMMMIQDLPVPGQEKVEESKPEEVPLSASLPMRAETDIRTGSISMLTREDRRMTARMSTDKPGSSGGGLPKWMKLSKK